jgi:hypothetical protein
MGKVSPESAETRDDGRALAAAGLTGGTAEVLAADAGHDCSELGMHFGFLSIDSNVISG